MLVADVTVIVPGYDAGDEPAPSVPDTVRLPPDAEIEVLPE